MKLFNTKLDLLTQKFRQYELTDKGNKPIFHKKGQGERKSKPVRFPPFSLIFLPMLRSFPESAFPILPSVLLIPAISEPAEIKANEMRWLVVLCVFLMLLSHRWGKRKHTIPHSSRHIYQ